MIVNDECQKHRTYGVYERFLKRPLDLLISCALLILLSPLIAGIALLVRIVIGAPVLFKQKRVGKDEKVFTLLKFRTMTSEKDENGKLLPDEKRLTRLGRSLRSSSLDELPQLLNIAKGDMAIIGPRPLLVEYLQYYSDFEKLRHDVRPGLTNLVSIRGRNKVSIGDKFRYDIEYVNHISFLMDVKIFFGTIIVVLKQSGTDLENDKYYDYFLKRESERTSNEILR